MVIYQKGNKMKISFDFDGTLSKRTVQEFAKNLIQKYPDLEVWIVSSRYDDAHKHLWTENPTNDDLYNLASNLGISKRNIHFTNMKYSKAEFFRNTNFVWHLDDDVKEVHLLNIESNVLAVQYLKYDDNNIYTENEKNKVVFNHLKFLLGEGL